MTTATKTSALRRQVETSTQRPALDLSLDSLVLLKRHGTSSVKNIVSPSHIRGWLESSPSEGERWLRHAAQDGDLYAMEKLGLRLLTGDGLAKSIEEGLSWLKKSAELGNPFAMEKIAECELDENETPRSSAEGERWLCAAVERGCRLAMVNLGARLITGSGLAPDPEHGERLLRDAAQQGSQIAMIKLGTYLLSGWGLDQNKEEGQRWLRRAGATNASQLLELGIYLYQKSLTATSKAARGLSKEASVLFQEAHRKGSPIASLNLAYLLRRGEIAEASFPSLDELLSEHLNQKDSFAFVNQALRLARGIQCNTDWTAADALIGKLQDSGNVLEWWSARSREGDPEGHLVTGWLGRHQLATDPDGFEIARRMDLARKDGWLVPEWMNHPATAQRSC